MSHPPLVSVEDEDEDEDAELLGWELVRRSLERGRDIREVTLGIQVGVKYLYMTQIMHIALYCTNKSKMRGKEGKKNMNSISTLAECRACQQKLGFLLQF